MKTGRSLQELAIEIKRQNNVKRDLLVDTREMEFGYDDDRKKVLMQIRQDAEFNVSDSLNFDSMDINMIAHRQIGTHTKIPATYYDRCMNEAPELLAESVNVWLKKNPCTRMVRTLDNVARAFLSDRYRRIDNFEIANTVLPIIGEMQGAQVKSCELTDSKMYLKVVNPRIQAEVKKGDVVQAGIIISNSETGMGSFSVSPLIYRLVCENGMIAETSLKKYHVGKRVEADDRLEIYRDETIMQDDLAFMMKVEDIVRTAVDKAKFNYIVEQMKAAAEARIEAASIPKVVELSAKSFNITQEESDSVLTHLIEGGDLSLYGLANAVTRTAKDVESYDRSTELESTGWKIMNMPRSEFSQINQAAA